MSAERPYARVHAPERNRHDRPKRHREARLPWKRWLLIGCAGWVVLMLAIGAPIGILLTPALGPISGWLVGGILYLIVGVITRR